MIIDAKHFSMKRLSLAVSAATLAMCAASALAATPYTSSNRDVLSANTGTWSAAGVTLGGTTFRNLGLQGVGRFSSGFTDPVTGETVGSVSDLQISNFSRTGDNTWSGTFNILPDRGFNATVGGVDVFSNYAARINTFDFTFTPYTSGAPTALQNQIQMNFTGSTRFTYDHDGDVATTPIFTTGLVANATTNLFGTAVPTVSGVTTQSDGSFANRLTVDAEGLILDPRAGMAGAGWISDEYGPYIYRFDSQKQIVGQLLLPDALVPHTGTDINFASTANGRRVNQGMEGIALSPSGNLLFGLVQSATIQDSGTGNQGRSNTRLAVYDVSADATPDNPVAQYVIQLPRVDDNGGTPSVNRTAAQSAIVALSDDQLLILSRDGNGRGANNGSPVFKSVLLADLSNATNIDGAFDGIGSAVAPGGVLSPSVTPIEWTEALNLLGKLDLDIAEIEQFGLNLAANNGDANTLSEKWEGLGLVPVGDGTGDFFLFLANDNDFQSTAGMYMNEAGALVPYDAGLDNDTVLLAYRVSAVPVPGAVWLLGSALAGLAGVARRRVAA